MSPTELAQKAGFKVPFGNWISPDGTFIISDSEENQHCQTLQSYLNETPGDNHLTWMNNHVTKGFIRIIFRNDIMCQVPGVMEDLWSEEPNFKKLLFILHRLDDTEVHVFSREFYIIGIAKDISHGRIDECKVRRIEQEKDHGKREQTTSGV